MANLQSAFLAEHSNSLAAKQKKKRTRNIHLDHLRRLQKFQIDLTLEIPPLVPTIHVYAE